MHKTMALTLLLFGCTAHAPDPEPTPAPAPAPTPGPRQPYVDREVATCRLHTDPLPQPDIHPWLLATAAQHFHPGDTPGGFDAYTGGDQFPWFDVFALDRPFIAARTARVAAATPSTLLVTSESGELGTLDRHGGRARWLGEKLYPVDAHETTTGVQWVVARTGTTWRLVSISTKVQVIDLGVPATIWDVRLAVTADDRVAVAWLEHDHSELRIRLAMEPDLAHPRVVDEVALPGELAELSRLTSVDLVIASDGPDGVGLAWRPLRHTGEVKPPDPHADDPWFMPMDPYDAEVRWFVVSHAGERTTSPRRQPTLAQRRNGGSGLGPFGLQINGMVAGRIGGRAMFAWGDGRWVLGARVDNDAAVVLTEYINEGRLLLRPGELLQLDSSRHTHAVALRCG